MSNPIDNYNKIVTTVNSVTSDYTFEADANNLIVIDTSNNRIGINTVHPQRSIHISGGDISSGIITPYLQMISGGEGVGSDFIPSKDSTFALGSESKQWKDVYVGTGSIYMNKKRIFSLDNSNNLIIDNSNGRTNEIQFQGEIKFKGGVTFDNTPIIRGGSQPTQTQKVNINGGNIYGTLIGKQTDGTLDTCGGFFSTLEVGSDASLNANVDISNHLTVLGDVSLNANVDISNHLTVLGDVSLNANVDISNHLTVLGDVSLNANVDISNHLTVLGDVSLNDNVDISNHLTVLGDVSFNSNLNIGNDLIIKNSIKFVFG